MIEHQEVQSPFRMSGAKSLAPALLAFAGCGIFASMLPPVPDHAYQFFQAERILDGARMYVDVGAADMHPPLFTWLAISIAAIGRVMGASGLMLYPVVVLGAIACGLLAWSRIAPLSGWLLVVLVVGLLPLAGPYYGQGEHLAVILSLPYLAASARAATGRELRGHAAIAVGLAAGIGLALKPYFALVWIGVEGYLALQRGRRSPLRPESVTIFAVFVLYIAATALLTPQFFAILPWLAQLYPNVGSSSVARLMLDARTLLLASGLAAGLTVRGDDPDRLHLVRVLSIAALAMWAAVLLQGKGWGYHWYPVTAIAVVIWGIALSRFADRSVIASMIGVVVAVVWMHAQADRTVRLLAGDPTELPRMMDIVERHGRGQSIVALTYYLEVAFPLVNITDVGWASPYGHLWMVPALYPEAWRGKTTFRYRDVGEWRELEQEMFDRLWTTIERDDPTITLVDRKLNSGFDMRAYFETDPRFRDRLARSPVLDTIGRYIVLGRPPPN